MGRSTRAGRAGSSWLCLRAMKVLLVDVPFGSQEIGGQRELFAGVENVIPALGLAYLAAVAEREGHEARILDCARGLTFDDVVEEVRGFQPRVVGIGATTPTLANAVRTAKIVRREVPGVVVVAGGPHPTAMPAQTAASGAFDFVIAGEGEGPFAALLAHVDGGGPAPHRIPGMVVAGRRPPRFGPRPCFEEDLDSLPFPARHLLPPLDAYRPCPASYRVLPLAHIMTSRGCPSRCTFCDRAVFGERYRERSVDDVMREVRHVVHRHGAREIRFFDDTFTVNRSRAHRLCDELERFRRHLPWTCLTKVGSVDRELLRHMRSAGCWQVLFGLESGDDRILASLGKRNTVAQNRDAVRWARAEGLRVRADFIVGTPLETAASLERTLALAKELPLDFAHFNKFVPFPGTELFRQLSSEGHEFDFSASSTLAHDALVYLPDTLSAVEYQAFLDRSYREFYARPRYLIRRLAGMRSWLELRAHLRGALSIARI